MAAPSKRSSAPSVGLAGRAVRWRQPVLRTKKWHRRRAQNSGYRPVWEASRHRNRQDMQFCRGGGIKRTVKAVDARVHERNVSANTRAACDQPGLERIHREQNHIVLRDEAGRVATREPRVVRFERSSGANAVSFSSAETTFFVRYRRACAETGGSDCSEKQHPRRKTRFGQRPCRKGNRAAWSRALHNRSTSAEEESSFSCPPCQSPAK